MKRRKFLENILKVTAIASVPAVVINEIIKEEPNRFAGEPLVGGHGVYFDNTSIGDCHSVSGWMCDDETKHIIQEGGWIQRGT